MIATMPYENYRAVVINIKQESHQINVTLVPPKAPCPIQIEHEGTMISTEAEINLMTGPSKLPGETPFTIVGLRLRNNISGTSSGIYLILFKHDRN